MKNIALYIVAAWCAVVPLSLVSCSNQEEVEQVKSEKSYTLDEGENQLVVEIPCRQAWTITGASEWCVPSTTSGRGKTSISVTVRATFDLDGTQVTGTVENITSGMKLTRDQITSILWNQNDEFVEDNTLSVHISNLKSKIGKYNGKPYVESIRGVGYQWKLDVVLYTD